MALSYVRIQILPFFELFSLVLQFWCLFTFPTSTATRIRCLSQGSQAEFDGKPSLYELQRLDIKASWRSWRMICLGKLWDVFFFATFEYWSLFSFSPTSAWLGYYANGRSSSTYLEEEGAGIFAAL
jgi:hypothetical protein